MAEDGLVEMTDKGIKVTPQGRLLIRNICMCFDVYLRSQMRQRQFSALSKCFHFSCNSCVGLIGYSGHILCILPR